MKKNKKDENKEFKKSKYEFLIASGLLAFIVAIITTVFITHINNVSSQITLESLRMYSTEIGNVINENMQADISVLQIYATKAASMDDLNGMEILNLLKTFQKTNRISSIEVFLPGNQMLTSSGMVYDTAGTMLYEEEAALGIHVSDRTTDFVSGKDNIVRIYVPIYKLGKKVAMMCGVVDTDSIANAFPSDCFEIAGSYFYVVDGNSGKIITASEGQKIDTVFDLSGRTIRGGKTIMDFKEDLEEGVSSHFVLKASFAAEEAEVYNASMSINNWSVVVFIPTGGLAAKAGARNLPFVIVLIASIVSLIGFSAWMYFYFSKESRDKQKRLDKVNYIYDVEKTLFSAHENKDKIQDALKAISKLTEAETAFFALWDVDRSKDETMYFVSERSSTQTVKRFLKSHDYFEEEFKQTEKEVVKKDYVAISIVDTDEKQMGVLGVSNPYNPWQAAYFLRQVAVSFSMLGMNIHTYDVIKEMGEVDALTGVMNRNCFESRQNSYAKNCRESVCVVYVDVNGLHELNNTQGHEAGDTMLRYVANAISNEFGRTDTFRMGGDEFVAVASDVFEGEIKDRLARIDEAMDQKGYHVAVGTSSMNMPVDMAFLTKRAETIMFDNKSRYYLELGNDRRRR
ncbi:MAG: diguanylate cyclase [Lachnospiraceae bacterium]|nr:diguanylate cyclase [Candidatus Merdinaster equi]